MGAFPSSYNNKPVGLFYSNKKITLLKKLYLVKFMNNSAIYLCFDIPKHNYNRIEYIIKMQPKVKFFIDDIVGY